MEIIQVTSQLEEKKKYVGKLFAFGQTHVLNIQLKAGEAIPDHDANSDVLVMVRNGKVLFNVEGKEMVLTDEQILYMEPMEMHGLKAIDDSDVLVIKIDR